MSRLFVSVERTPEEVAILRAARAWYQAHRPTPDVVAADGEIEMLGDYVARKVAEWRASESPIPQGPWRVSE